jgi:hypothetical protein
MVLDEPNLEVLSTRSGFNSAVRHIQKTLGIVESLTPQGNLGDMLYGLGEGVSFLLRMLLLDKLGYRAVSANLASVAADPPALAAVFAKWRGVDLVAAYHHPDLGLLAANPQNADQLANFGPLRKRELLVVYAGNCRGKGAGPAGESCIRAAKLAVDLFEGRKVRVPVELTGPAAKERGAAKERTRGAAPAHNSAAPVTGSGPVRMTPLYSVAVTNELFHNGNVEAWERIIDSYKTKYPELRIYVYYDGERILDINSLFKWGKVKHGRSIQFAVAGKDIRDVAKLQRYLAQGASNQFEAFIRYAASDVLRLF